MSEGRLFARSLVFLEKWIAELAPKPVAAATAAAPAAAAAATAAKKGVAAPAAAPAAAAAAGAAAEGSSLSKVSFLVGRVVEVAKHPESAKLYVEKVDLGEKDGPRTILSGLQEHVTEAEFLNRLVVVVANLEPRKIGGIASQGMVLCASTKEKSKTELLQVPEGTPLGERIVFPGHDQPAEPVLKKKLVKHWEDTMPLLNTNANGECCWGDLVFKTSKGVIKSTIPSGILS